VAPESLETARLTLRPCEPGDLDAFASMMGDPEVVRFLGGRTLDRAETAERLKLWRERFDRDGFGAFAVVRREDRAIVGRCGLLVWELPDWTTTTAAEAVGPYEVEVGWVLGRPYWGSGYATEAAHAVVDFARSTLRRKRLISLIDPANDASAAVARRLGMTVEGSAKVPGGAVDVWALALE
jgi:RimJ/RimL family protein N-acetyltransferase